MKRIIPGIIFSYFSFLVCYAQGVSIDTELTGDRPDQTESASVVPVKFIQIETGVSYSKDKSESDMHENLSAGGTLIRIGIYKNLEFRIEGGYEQIRLKSYISDESSTLKGLAPFDLGFKVKLMEENGLLPEMAFLGSLGLPNSGKKEFSSEYVTPSFRFAFEHTLSARLSLAYNLGMYWEGESVGGTGIYSLVTGISVTERIGTYIELYGYLPEKSQAQHLMDFGFTWLTGPDFQLDIEGGVGLNKLAPDWFIGFGTIWRVSR
ncbi:MAG: transporter [Bacteroidales bacterium]|nr:transporter [Bacteroidales bacterium]